MTPVFADTFYFLALMNPGDRAHRAALAWASNPTGPLVTTAWVLTDLADALSTPSNRPAFLTLHAGLRADPACEIVPACGGSAHEPRAPRSQEARLS